MTVWFRYSFECPTCGETISSGDAVENASSRDEIPNRVHAKHSTCPHCERPQLAPNSLPCNTLPLSLWGSGFWQSSFISGSGNPLKTRILQRQDKKIIDMNMPSPSQSRVCLTPRSPVP